MPISSGAGGKPNSYFNPANSLGQRGSISYGSGYGYYGGGGGGGYGGDLTTPRQVQVVEVAEQPAMQQKGSVNSSSRNSSRSCCPCPSRGRSEMRMPQMPKSKLAPAGTAISRRGCFIFLLALLAMALVAGLIAGLYFLGVEISGIRGSRGLFFLTPGRRTGDLMWVIYGRTQECEPDSTSTTSTTTTATTAGSTGTTATGGTTATTAATTTTTATTLIPCASTTFSYVQVTLGADQQAQPLQLQMMLMMGMAMMIMVMMTNRHWL